MTSKINMKYENKVKICEGIGEGSGFLLALIPLILLVIFHKLSTGL